MAEQTVTTVKRGGTALAMFLAPATTAVGFLLHPRVTEDAAEQLAIVAAQPGRWALAHLLILLGGLLFIPAALGVAGHLAGRAAWAGLLGTSLATVGALFVGVVIGVDAFAPSAFADLPAAERAALTPAMAALLEGRGLVPLANLVALLSLGFVVLAAALLVGRRAPRWASVALGLGALLQGFLNVPALLIVGVAGCLLMALGTAPIALDYLRPAATAPRPQATTTGMATA